MKLNLTNKIVDFLTTNPEKKFTAREIAEWVFENYEKECREKQKSAKKGRLKDDEALIDQLTREVSSRRPRAQKIEPRIKTTEGRPRKYYYTESTDSAEIYRAESSREPIAYAEYDDAITEQDLYDKLSDFLLTELGIHSKRIDEKRSRNSHGAGGNKWLYPDLVGMEELSQGWHNEIKECVKEYGDKKTKLWSFEVKKLINRSNVREAFFQATSNSSWANFGYLVAGEVIGDDTMKELRILSSLHGIGFIKLDAKNPSESQIMIPARERNGIDWDTANRLTEENEDFQDYIKIIRQFHQTGDIESVYWYSPDEED